MKIKRLPTSPSTMTSQVHRLWTKRAAKGRDRLLIFSPYVTGPVARRLVERFAGNEVELYTTFEAETFVARGSSLETLRTMQVSGAHLFMLPGLHAKIVCIDDDFVSIGSQNLTRGGTLNKEASLVFRNQDVAGQVQDQLAAWLKVAQPITPTMIDVMADLIKPLMKPARRLRTQLRDVDRKFSAAAVAQAAALERQRLARLQLLMSRLPTSSETVRGVIRDPPFDGRNLSSYLAVYGARKSFLHWTVGGKENRLEGTKRYLIIREDIGWLGWGRINQTRITFINNGLDLSDFTIGDRPVPLKIIFPWEKTKRDTNVEFIFGSSGTALKLRAWFDTDSLTNLDVDATFDQTEGSARVRAFLLHQLGRKKRAFLELLIKQLRQPFYYSTRLTGRDARGFFAGRESFELTLKVQDGQSMLVASSI